MPYSFQWNTGHKPLVSSQFFLVLLDPIVLQLYLKLAIHIFSRYFVTEYFLVVFFLCGLLVVCTVTLAG